MPITNEVKALFTHLDSLKKPKKKETIKQIKKVCGLNDQKWWYRKVGKAAFTIAEKNHINKIIDLNIFTT